MIDRIDFEPHDRVLFLSIPEPAVVARAARGLPHGLIVALGNDEQVRAARRAHRDLDNVMFVAAAPDDIPWQDGFFSIAIDLDGRWRDSAPVARELARVLASGGKPVTGYAIPDRT